MVNLTFSPEFAIAVEEKQIAEQRAQRAVYIAQEAQAEINRAKGKSEAQRLLAQTLKAPGGQLVLQKKAIETWKNSGAQMRKVLLIGKDSQSSVPFLFNVSNIQD